MCNGDGTNGTNGTNALVKTSPEDTGANCPFGGVKIETGLDTNNNGTLDAGEVNNAATSFVCNFGPNGAISPSTGINIAFKPNGITTTTGTAISVRFTAKDDRGFPIDFAIGKTSGAYSINTPVVPRFSLAYFTTSNNSQGNPITSPLTVYTKSGGTPQPTAYNPTSTGQGTLVENGLGAGDYTYTFPTTTTPNGAVGVAYDATKMDETHVLWIQASRQTDLVFSINANTFYTANAPLYYVPSGATAPAKRELVTAAACNSCHGKFKAETTTSAEFHGGGRIDGTYCNVCHNPGRVTNPLADSVSFIHRIHNGEMVADANLFHGIAATYPQDTRNCDACHKGAAQEAQIETNPSTLACKGCHDYVSFTNSATAFCGVTGQLVRGTDGKPVACNHIGGPQPDSACATCHGPSPAPFPTSKYHTPVVAPDPNNALLVVGGNANTNAAFVAASGAVPAGADVITYDVKSVDAVADAAITPNKRLQITFKLKKNGTDVVFQTFQAGVTTELIPNFIGSPSVYFAFAVPQDGVATPSDFNGSASGYIKKIWDGSATGTGAGTLTGPDGSGYYTIKLTGVQIPPTTTMLTGGLGYTYNVTSALPLTQTNVAGFPLSTDGKNQGGLIVPAPNVVKVATGFTGRRQIVDNAKCKNCHASLGVSPGGSFHAGQRNDGPTCAFCHNPNRTSSGWAASSKYAIHAIHAGRKRVVPFTWHASEAGPGYDEVEFPGTLNVCTTCHVPNTFDFTNASNLASVQNMELTAVGTGKYSTDPLINSTYFTVSPYVVADNVTDYGAGFSYNAGTGVTTQGSANNLVISPITAACSACHDTPIAIAHMKSNGGLFYATRGAALANGGQTEECLICHGPGRTAAIGEVHSH